MLMWLMTLFRQLPRFYCFLCTGIAFVCRKQMYMYLFWGFISLEWPYWLPPLWHMLVCTHRHTLHNHQYRLCKPMWWWRAATLLSETQSLPVGTEGVFFTYFPYHPSFLPDRLLKFWLHFLAELWILTCCVWIPHKCQIFNPVDHIYHYIYDGSKSEIKQSSSLI